MSAEPLVLFGATYVPPKPKPALFHVLALPVEKFTYP